MRSSPILTLVSLSFAAGCASIRGTEPSTVSTAQTVATAYWFRGSPRSLEPVTQGDLSVNTPLALGGTLSFTTWYNLQLTNRTGDALFPDGQGGEATEIDLVVNYSQRLGPVAVSVGGIGYHFPEIGSSTKEAYLGGTIQALGLSHGLTAYYDLDLLDDFYLLYQTSRGFVLDEHWSAALALFLGYMSADQSALYFGTDDPGLSDLLLTGSLTYRFDDNTSLFVKGAGVTVPDDELSDSLDAAGIEDSGLWLSIGAAWGL